MEDICSAIVRTDKFSMIAFITLYINPSRNDKENVMQRLMDYTEFLSKAYTGLKIVIFGGPEFEEIETQTRNKKICT